MQSKMFVFFGLPNQNSKTDISHLLERLNLRFSTFLEFTRKGDLLSAEVDEVLYFVSLLNSKDEISDYVQMGKDFELSIDLSVLSEKILEERYQKLKASNPDLYNDVHYSVAKTIFEEMNRFSNINIFSFQ